MSLAALGRRIEACRRCPRLVAWREEVARVKRRAYRDEAYWGRPITGFGDPQARLVIVGLAPGAHGANRTGRIFTGDASGDFLHAALHRAGFASQPTSTHRGDGLTLRDVWITCPVRCAPPDNRPTPGELAACRPFLTEELGLLRPVAFLALGQLAWTAVLAQLSWPRPLPAFSHGVHSSREGVTVVGSYHVSRQNTQTGRLTSAMFDEVLGHVVSVLDGGRRPADDSKRRRPKSQGVLPG
jgi:uracil-DNA glycosylase family 4